MSTETKKQTAIQWLQESLNLHLLFEQKVQFEGLFQQALKMEKEQIIAALDNFQTNKWGEFLNGEEYYEETYGTKTES